MCEWWWAWWGRLEGGKGRPSLAAHGGQGSGSAAAAGRAALRGHRVTQGSGAQCHASGGACGAQHKRGGQWGGGGSGGAAQNATAIGRACKGTACSSGQQGSGGKEAEHGGKGLEGTAIAGLQAH